MRNNTTKRLRKKQQKLKDKQLLKSEEQLKQQQFKEQFYKELQELDDYLAGLDEKRYLAKGGEV